MLASRSLSLPQLRVHSASAMDASWALVSAGSLCDQIFRVLFDGIECSVGNAQLQEWKRSAKTPASRAPPAALLEVAIFLFSGQSIFRQQVGPARRF